jgi:hypothetical protein
MVNRDTLKQWFVRGARPLASQFAEWIDSFVHKDDAVPAGKVEGLQAALDGKASAEALASVNADIQEHKTDAGAHATLMADKVDKSQSADRVYGTDGDGAQATFSKSSFEASANKTSAIGSTSDANDTKYPTEKAVRTELDGKVDKVPDGTNSLLDDTYKFNPRYIPDVILGQLRYGGGFNGSGVITASANVPELQGTGIGEVTTADYPGVFFIALEDYTFNSIAFHTGDWAVCNGDRTPAWMKVDNSDAVMSVNGLLGVVNLYGSNIHMSNETGAKTIKEAIESKANETTSFTEAASRANIATGDSVTTIWGKIKKYFSDLKTVAFTGSYADLTGTPTLHAVATSGDYDDLKDKPTIPTIPTLAAVATSGAYSDLTGTPTVHTGANPPTSGMKAGDFYVKTE